MLKTKHLHRKSRISNDNYKKDYHKKKNMDLFSELPIYEPYKKKFNSFDLTILRKFIRSKIGQSWNDVYSEICKKTKHDFRYIIDNLYIIYLNPIYDEDFLPRDNRGSLLKDVFFVDLNGIIQNKNLQELRNDSKKYLRKKKLLEIIENQLNEQKIIKNQDSS